MLDGDPVSAESGARITDDCPCGHGRSAGGAGRALDASEALGPALVPGDPPLPAMASLLQVQRSRTCVGASVDRRAARGGECVAAGTDQPAGEGGRGKLDDPAVFDVEVCFHWLLPSVGSFSSCSVPVRGSPLVLSGPRAGSGWLLAPTTSTASCLPTALLSSGSCRPRGDRAPSASAAGCLRGGGSLGGWG